MSIPHSPGAALVDACDCGVCRSARREPEARSDTVCHTEDWYLFTIRSRDATALAEHRRYMQQTGWIVGGITIAGPGHSHQGKYIFPARMLKVALPPSEMAKLVEWDKSQGE